jgi:hypothetical protein
VMAITFPFTSKSTGISTNARIYSIDRKKASVLCAFDTVNGGYGSKVNGLAAYD